MPRCNRPLPLYAASAARQSSRDALHLYRLAHACGKCRAVCRGASHGMAMSFARLASCGFSQPNTWSGAVGSWQHTRQRADEDIAGHIRTAVRGHVLNGSSLRLHFKSSAASALGPICVRRSATPLPGMGLRYIFPRSLHTEACIRLVEAKYGDEPRSLEFAHQGLHGVGMHLGAASQLHHRDRLVPPCER